MLPIIEIEQSFFEHSDLVGYQNTILGIHRNASIENKYFRIKNMSHSLCHWAVRFVISKDNKLWSDNTHWTMVYIRKRSRRISIRYTYVYC